MNKIILVMGGARSGKSSFAEKYALSYEKEKRIYLATAEIFDEEMKKRVMLHKKGRADKFITFEEPLYLSKKIEEINKISPSFILVDCLSVWLGNMLYHLTRAEMDIQIDKFIQSLKKIDCPILLVINCVSFEVFDTSNKECYLFLEKSEYLNKEISKIADEVYFLLLSIAKRIK